MTVRLGIGGGGRLLRGGFSVGRGGVRGGVGVGPISLSGGGGGRRSGSSDDGSFALVLVLGSVLAVGIVYAGAYGLARIMLPIAGVLLPLTTFFVLLWIGDLVERYWFDLASYAIWAGLQIASFVVWSKLIPWADANGAAAGENAAEDSTSRLSEAAWYSVGDGANIARWVLLATAIVILTVWVWSVVSDRFADSLESMSGRLEDWADRIERG